MRAEWQGRQRPIPAIAMAAVLALAACGAKATLPTSLEPEKPIAAHVFAAPADYVGKRIEIYGLVVETRRGGREFLLQDVSQMPLKVVRSDGMPTFPGDQVLVEGTVFLEGGRPTLAASRVRDTRVLGGGGCC